MSTADVIIGMVVNIIFTTYIIIYSIHLDKRNVKRGDNNVHIKPFKRRTKVK